MGWDVDVDGCTMRNLCQAGLVCGVWGGTHNIDHCSGLRAIKEKDSTTVLCLHRERSLCQNDA